MAYPDYKYFIQRDSKSLETEEAVSIEDYFPGCKYLSFDGLSVYGAPKNITIEEYPEADEPRVYIPDVIVRETTDVTLTLYFVGAGRRDVYDNFVNFITGRKLTYWDTCRNRHVRLLFNNKTTITSDIVKGGKHYMMAEFKFTNLKGSSENKDMRKAITYNDMCISFNNLSPTYN